MRCACPKCGKDTALCELGTFAVSAWRAVAPDGTLSGQAEWDERSPGDAVDFTSEGVFMCGECGTEFGHADMAVREEKDPPEVSPDQMSLSDSDANC